MSKRVIGIVAGVVILAVIVGFNVTRDSRSRVAVQVKKAGKSDLVSVVSASGEVRPKRFVNISANVSGRITYLPVKEGETVKKGQLLARIDSTRFEADARQSQAAVEAQKADLDRAIAELEVARLAFDRNKKMHADKLVSDQTFDQSEAEIKMKTAAVDATRKRMAQQQAMLESSQDNLEKTTVVAPMDGAITSLQREEGEMVIGAQSFQPTVIMIVADLSVMEVEVLVDETDIRNVKLGLPAEVRVDALEGIKIPGEVTEIGSSAIVRGASAAQVGGASTANQAKDFKVTVTLTNPPPTLRPGLNATADIETARKAAVLAIPIQAVVVRALDKQGKVIDVSAAPAEGGNPVAEPREKGEEKEGVFVVEKSQAFFRPIKTGIMGEAEIEITEGLTEGAEIVTGSYKTLRTLRNEARVKAEMKKERR